MRKILTFFILIFGLGLHGCSTGIFTVYKIDIQQGNALPEDKVEQLHAGMSRRQVKFLLGTPLLTDPFEPDRWDYIYYLKRGHKAPVERRLTVFFKDGKVVDFEKSPPG